ncbi:hypothetical protein IQ06DRAFT_129025 [Phaeosphaeriaceae sp. SRC1lsM3a]|nr:hypothetical protein IQ06DRAFT_129025 [Stagonospora sp. SRC1lsM3a]
MPLPLIPPSPSKTFSRMSAIPSYPASHPRLDSQKHADLNHDLPQRSPSTRLGCTNEFPLARLAYMQEEQPIRGRDTLPSLFLVPEQSGFNYAIAALRFLPRPQTTMRCRLPKREGALLDVDHRGRQDMFRDLRFYSRCWKSEVTMAKNYSNVKFVQRWFGDVLQAPEQRAIASAALWTTSDLRTILIHDARTLQAKSQQATLAKSAPRTSPAV